MIREMFNRHILNCRINSEKGVKNVKDYTN